MSFGSTGSLSQMRHRDAIWNGQANLNGTFSVAPDNDDEIRP